MAAEEHPENTPDFAAEAPQTAARFPHIIERLHATWGDRPECHRFLQSLQVDERGDRQGFPMPVLLEIMHLNDLFERAGDDDKGGDSWSSHESVL